MDEAWEGKNGEGGSGERRKKEGKEAVTGKAHMSVGKGEEARVRLSAWIGPGHTRENRSWAREIRPKGIS